MNEPREGEGKVARPALYLVATPIGNLEDITLRALRVLKEVDVIACEDTRQTQKLLSHYGIRTRTVSYHEHNEMTKAAELVVDLEGGAKIALVTDAGMPGISDPGFRLITLAIRHQKAPGELHQCRCRYRERASRRRTLVPRATSQAQARPRFPCPAAAPASLSTV